MTTLFGEHHPALRSLIVKPLGSYLPAGFLSLLWFFLIHTSPPALPTLLSVLHTFRQDYKKHHKIQIYRCRRDVS